MDIKNSLPQLYSSIDSILKPAGFKINLSRNEFSKGTKINWCKIDFDMNKMYDFTFNINCAFKVRNSIIRNIREKTISDDGFKGDKWFCILYKPYKLCECYYPNIIDWESTRDPNTNISGKVVDFTSQLSIDKWIIGFKKFMDEAGFDFFNRFSDFNGFDRWLNDPIIRNPSLVDVYIAEWDSFSGLIAAKICQNPHYNDIYKIWEEYFIKNSYESVRKEFLILKSFLDLHSREELLQTYS